MPFHDDERRRTGPFGYPLDDPAALALEEREATQGTTPPAIADPGQQAEYIELNSRISEAEAKVAADEALADSQERDLRYEGVTPYEAARVTGKWREEARAAKLNIAGMRAQQAEIEATAPPPDIAGVSGLPGEAAQAGAFHLPGAGLPGAGLPGAGLPAPAPSAPAARDSALRSAAGLPPITAPAIGQALNADAPTMDGVANTPVNRNQPPPVIAGALGGAPDPLGGSLPPVTAKDHAEYIDLNSKIAKVEAKVAADEALADSQERDLRREGVTQYESARVTGKLREEARTAKFNIANMRAEKAEFEAAMKPPAPPPAGGAKTRTAGGGRWQFTVPGEAGSSPLVKAAYEPAGPVRPGSGNTGGGVPIPTTAAPYAPAIADMDDAGLAGLADSRLGIEGIAALEPRTYDEYMRYARAIAESAGLGEDALLNLQDDLRMDDEGIPRHISGSQTMSAKDGEIYAAFIDSARAQRNTPLDFPRTEDGTVDMTRVQPDFVYKTGDGVLFMVDPDWTKFVEVRKLRKPDAGGGLYEPVANPQPFQFYEQNGDVREVDAITAQANGLAEQAGRGFSEADDVARAARKANRLLRQLKANPLGKSYAHAFIAKAYGEATEDLNNKVDELYKAVTPETVTTGDMAGRMDLPGRAGNAVNSAVRGGGEVFASIPMFMAVSESMFFRDVYADWDEIDKNRDYLEFGLSPNSMRESLAFDYSVADKETREWLRQRYRQHLDPRTTGLYQAGQSLKSALEKEFETNPKFADEFFASKLPRALGEMIAKGATVATLTAIGIPTPVSGAMLGAMTESSGLFQKAIAEGKPIDEAYRQFGFGALMGMTEGLPLAEMLQRADKTSGGAVRGLLKDALAEGTEEAVIEAIRQAGRQMSSPGVADPEEVKAAFTAGAVKEFAISLIGAQK